MIYAIVIPVALLATGVGIYIYFAWKEEKEIQEEEEWTKDSWED